MAEKQPWMKLYTKDILADEELKSCSLAARGFFLYLLSLMHRSVRRGYLCQANGQPWNLDQLARMTGCSTQEAAHLSQELLTSGVFSATDDGTGVLYSRRMVRENNISEARSKAGKAGANSTHGKVAEILPRQNSGKGSGKPVGKVPGKPLVLVMNNQDCVLGEEEKKELDSDPPGLGVQGEGVLPRQNSGKQVGKPPNDDLSSEWLARVWCNECRAMRGRIARDRAEDISPQFAEWIAFGVPAAEIDAEMKAPRDRTEHLWQFKQRLFDRLGIGKASRKTKAQTIAENEAAFNDELAKLLADNPAFKGQPP